MIFIYTPKITKRVEYIFKLFFKQLLNIEYEITLKPEIFKQYNGVKINYSNQRFEDSLNFQPVDLLFKTGIDSQELKTIVYKGQKVFFPVYDPKSNLPFDPFAAAFYLVSRYEEYLPYKKDRFGRFDAPESFSFQQNILDKPLVNIWAYWIRNLLLEKFPDLKFRNRTFQFLPTYDIDSAYAYKNKGFVRIAANFARDLINGRLSDMKERFRVIIGKQADPFDTFDFQFSLQREYDLQPLYFILIANYGEYDKNLPVNNLKFQQLIKSLSDYAEVGIHPSFGSSTSYKLLTSEIERLSRILNREIVISRQHFLRLDFPITYRNLIQADITDDYTMGYASAPGFRAGICDAFNFYDLDMEVETSLRIHPFQVMDGTLRDYMQTDVDGAIEIIRKLIDEVKAVDGTFSSLWHNESLSNKKRWEGWRTLYVDMIRHALI
ncbi:MAG: polysaccharide deacetylase family protein [Bacteroidales bacterium]|jgi:hypothetical protein|nr:polysaccharide deacetylase family protein [Bacteroidales bacterium]MDI9592916.1 polysaccharide deacetylase family protein [Bacteroidota bacterium]OQC37987.1 MAG: hypothetical protein BWX63_00633 [Bacteroidetes bacterium ADurb.Bin041]MBP7873936.1 polysaccharide deacetylase family protein [Bacteroidales bacterium]MCO6468988.1 polysaccharide deacetylase family protein [Bacteroidales bacterium]